MPRTPLLTGNQSLINIKDSIQEGKAQNASLKGFSKEQALAQPLYLGRCPISLPRTAMDHLTSLLESPEKLVPMSQVQL